MRRTMELTTQLLREIKRDLSSREGEMLRLLGKFVRAESPSLDKEAVDKFGRMVAAEWRARGAKVSFLRQRERGDHLLVRLWSGKGRPAGRPVRLVVGISDGLPKLIAYRLLQPALTLPEPVQIVCHEDRPERLLAELATFGLDLILTDAPVGPLVRVRAFSHLLGSSGTSFFGTSSLAARYRKHFPASLDGAPFLLPLENATLRRSLEQWFEAQRIRPRVVGEFQDSALLKTFGQAGGGIFAAPTVTEKEVRQQHRVSVLGRTESVIERFYAISVERRLKHPAVVAIAEAARDQLFRQPL